MFFYVPMFLCGSKFKNIHQQNIIMKKISIPLIAITTVIICAITSCNDAQSSSIKSTHASNNDSSTELVNRGKYLVTSIGCDDCHSPKKMGSNGPEVIADFTFLRLSF